MHFDWWTFGLQVFNFLILMWILQHFLYKPVRRFMAERQAEAERTLNEADAANMRADEFKKEYEAKAEALINERDILIQDARTQINKEQNEALEKNRADAQLIIDNERLQIDKERQQALKYLEAETLELALHLAENIMKSMATPEIADSFLARVNTHIESLTKDDLEGLKTQLKNEGAKLKVTTWPKLDHKAKAKWKARLHDHLGLNTKILFSNDERLIAGAELRFPGAVLHFSWRDSLDMAKKELAPDGHK